MSGCAGNTEPPDEDVVVGRVEDPLASGAVQWLNGTYTHCSNRTGSWSARVSGTATMDNTALTVVTGDSGCLLTITGLMGDQEYTASPAIALGTAYAASPSTFAAGATTFVGNAQLDSTAFATNFTISFVYGGGDQAPTVTSSTVSGGYASVTGFTSVTLVAGANYTIDVTNLRFTDNLVNLIVSLTGSVTLTNGTITADSYAIDMGTLAALPSYSQVATAYNNASSTVKSISGVTNPTIQASEFNVLALSVLGSTQVRNVIVKRTVGGIAAYQVFVITFYS